jgi:hypothetical protein
MKMAEGAIEVAIEACSLLTLPNGLERSLSGLGSLPIVPTARPDIARSVLVLRSHNTVTACTTFPLSVPLINPP